MENNKDSNANAPASKPEQKVVFEQPAAADASAIPEEYLTDEDLYPAQSADSGSIGGVVKKKAPLIVIAIVAVFVFIIFLVVLSKLFGGAGQSKTQPVTLKYWGVWQPANVIGELIKEYQKEHPNITIEYTLMDAKDNYRERIIERTRNGIGPDIFRFHNTWVPTLKELFVPAPSTVTTAEDFQNLYYPVIVKDLVVDDQVIGFPYNLDGLVLLSNETLLKNAGVDAPPTDWEDLIAVAKNVAVKDESGNLVTTGVALGSAENISHFSDILGLMFLQNGVDIKNLANNQNAETVLDTYTDFVLSANNVWTDSIDDSIAAFASEQVAMILAPTWEIEVIKHLNPDLNLKVSAVPQIRGGVKKNLASYWADGVSRGSKFQKEAWEFLKFLSEKEQQAKLFELEVKNGRLSGNIYPRKDMAELLIDNEYFAPLVVNANILDSLPLVSRTYDNGLNDGLVGYLKDGVNSILLNSSTSEAVNVINQGFTEVFTKYNY